MKGHQDEPASHIPPLTLLPGWCAALASSAKGQGTIVGTITSPAAGIVSANVGFPIEGNFSKSATGGPSRDRVRVEIAKSAYPGVPISFWNDTMDDSPMNKTNFSTTLSTKLPPIVTAGTYIIKVRLQHKDPVSGVYSDIATVSKTITAQ